MNREIREFEEKLVSTVNESKIPSEAKRFVLMSVLNSVQRVADTEILMELRDFDADKGEVDNAESTRLDKK